MAAGFPHRTLLFGGTSPQTGSTDKTWSFDGAGWTLSNGSHTPGRDFGMAFDAVRRAMVRFGGIAGSVTNANTFEYGARAREFGTGCPGSNGVPTMSTSGAPRLGTNWSLTLNNRTLTAPFAVVVLSLTEIAPLPLASIGMSGCNAYVTPDLLVAVPAAVSAAVWSGAIPNQQSLLGIELLAQALSLDPGIHAAGLTVSNATVSVLGF